MEEIKVGEYVRTASGIIYKVTNLNDYVFLSDIFYNFIVKHSLNIIDLIEVEDYVNGSKVLEIETDEKNEIILKTENYYYPNIYENGLAQIKSIVTKEQFAIAEYILEE